MLTQKNITDILKKIKDPESDQSLFELKLIKHVDYISSGKKLIIALDFNRRMPHCFGCVPIAWLIQRKIVKELGSEFLQFEDVEDVDFKYF